MDRRQHQSLHSLGVGSDSIQDPPASSSFHYLSRRHAFSSALGALVSATLQGCVTRQSGRENLNPLSDEEVAYLTVEEDRSLIGGMQTEGEPFTDWHKMSKADRPPVQWPSTLMTAPDYRHLADYTADDDPHAGLEFEIDADVLDRLMKSSFFSSDVSSATHIAFGLRGCSIANGEPALAFSRKQKLRVALPDHWNPRCVMGVYAFADRQVAVYSASTVANVTRMYRALKSYRGERANLLPTGTYIYVVGAHGRDPKGERPPRQPGALRQSASRLVWRLQPSGPLSFSVGNIDLAGSVDDWDWDNLHAAVREAGQGPLMSSAGCQVVVGDYRNGQPRGAWSAFRQALGLQHPINLVNALHGQTIDDGLRIQFCLWTGLEAALMSATSGVPEKLQCIRHGSNDPRIVEINRKCGINSGSSAANLQTMQAIRSWQVSRSSPATGLMPISQLRSLMA